jgi:hypothetical protein
LGTRRRITGGVLYTAIALHGSIALCQIQRRNIGLDLHVLGPSQVCDRNHIRHTGLSTVRVRALRSVLQRAIRRLGGCVERSFAVRVGVGRCGFRTIRACGFRCVEPCDLSYIEPGGFRCIGYTGVQGDFTARVHVEFRGGAVQVGLAVQPNQIACSYLCYIRSFWAAQCPRIIAATQNRYKPQQSGQ